MFAIRLPPLPGLLALFLLSACAGRGVPTAGPETVTGVDPSLVHGPYVPAGQNFTIVLRGQLSTATAVAGQPFRATVESPIVGSDGQIIVRTGAALLGHIDTVADGSSPRIELQFDAVQTVSGVTPVIARVLEVLNEAESTREVERSLLAFPLVSRGPTGTSVGLDVTPARVVVLPAGSLIRLELTRALFPPGTDVGP